MAMTAKEVYELAQKLPKGEKRKLLNWLARDLGQGKGKRVRNGKVSKGKLSAPCLCHLI